MQLPHLSEQEEIRREKLAELIMMGIEPYPASLYPVNNNARFVKENFTEEKKDDAQSAGFRDVCVAGRAGKNEAGCDRRFSVQTKTIQHTQRGDR